MSAQRPAKTRRTAAKRPPRQPRSSRADQRRAAADEIGDVRRREALYRTIADNAPDAIYLLDREGRIVYVNPVGARFFGKEPTELIGKRQDEIFAAEHGTRHRQSLEHVWQSKAGRFFQVPELIAERGIWMDTRLIPIGDETGAVTAIMGISRDITERHNIEAALHESESRCRALIELVPAVIYEVVIAEQDTTVFLSPQVERLTGCKPTELGKSPEAWLTCIHPDDRERVRRSFEQARGEGRVLDCEYRVCARDGTVRWVRDRAACVQAAADAPQHLHGVIIDITDRKEAQARLEAHRTKLRAMASALTLAEEGERRRIALGLHDDIGQKLLATRLKIERLRKELTTASQREFADQILTFLGESIAAVRTLTFDLSSPVLADLGLEAAVQTLAEQFEKQHELSVVFKDDGQEKPVANDTALLLLRVVRELLFNVVKHAGTNVARVELARQDHTLRVTVQDFGRGFDAAAVADNYAVGVGFGLFSIRERMAHAGGTVEIHSSVRRGTRVVVAVPLSKRGA